MSTSQRNPSARRSLGLPPLLMRAAGPMPVLSLILILIQAGCREAAGDSSRGQAATPQPPRPPNVIFILADTLRADFLGSYGFEGEISPHLDALAAESVVFDNCLSQAPWTKPSMASIMTSTYPRVHQLTNHNGMFWSDATEDESLQTGVLPQESVTLAESFREAGYATAAFVSNPWIAGEFGFGQGFDVYADDQTGRSLPCDIFLAQARDWLAERDDERPFFLYLHLMDVHDPFHAPFTDARALKSSPNLGADRRLSEAPPAYLADNLSSLSLVEWRSRYAANVRAFDRRLSFFLDGLRTSGLLDESWLVFTSDHGEELAEHGHWAHGFTLQHHQVHVPLFLRAPGGLGGGRRVTSAVQSIDIYPTLVALAGGESPDSVQGLSRVRELGLPEAPRSVGGDDFSFASAARLTPGLYSVRTRRYSYLVDLYTEEEWLYDRLLDPGEQWNLAKQEADTVRQLRKRLDAHLEEMEAHGGVAPDVRPVDEDRLEELRSLGYTR